MQPRTSEQAVCAACGFASPPEFRFCGGCGVSLERREPERRQLTVLFCDLAGSTRLASRLDPEQMREVMLAYQSACGAIVRRYDGCVSRYVGDGILALFGYPRGHEDNAERAVRAGLELVSAIARLPVPPEAGAPLAARVGIATGLVVIGDLVGETAAEKEAVIGETPNLAARLQDLAAPNTVVIAPGTRALIGEHFECAELGLLALRGFAEKVRVCRVLAPGKAASRFEAAKPARLAPLVGREELLAGLLGLWQRAEQGAGQVVLLAGEAGIGKSRAVEALLERLGGTPYSALRYQCSPHYANTALYPVIDHIERGARIGREDAGEVKLAKLSAWLGASDGSDALPLLAALLSIPGGERFALPPMSAQRQKERTFELLLGFVRRLASAWPVPLVFEDVHWMDPTTRELLAQLVERAQAMRVLVILTFRPETFSPPWRKTSHVSWLPIGRLDDAHARGLVRQVSGAQLPEKVVDEVVRRADGVPLFIEELTRAVLGTGLLAEAQKRAPAALPALAIPSTLQDSLMARLDQLGPAKIIAQVAGAVGREFSHALLEAVVPLPPERLRLGLQALEQSGLVHAEPRAGAGAYVFKHALVQEVAYQSLLASRRRELHRSIAGALEQRFPQTARDSPELVAHHWAEAEDFPRAVSAWLAAGRRASERSEYREAIAHLRAGLALAPRLADAQMHRAQELALLLALGPALITTEGGGKVEVRAVYQRALELCDGAPESAAHFAAYWGWWRTSMNLRAGRDWADRMLSLGKALDDPALLLQAHHCQWATHYMLGSHGDCCDHIDRGLELYRPERDLPYAALYAGHDARVCALGERALARWLLGHHDEARQHAHAALAWAQELRHVGSIAHAMDYQLVLERFRGNAERALELAGRLMAFAVEEQLHDHRAKAALFRGWARTVLRDEAGLDEMLEGLALFRGVGTPEDISLYYEMLAEALGNAGRCREGLQAIDEAFEQTERCGILFWNPELHRRRGELLLASGAPLLVAADCFREALACARAQGAVVLEQRAADCLARLQAAA